MILKRGDETIFYPCGSYGNISNPTLEMLLEIGFVVVTPPTAEPLPPIIPQIISMRQCEKYLWSLDSGTTLQAVNALATTLGPLAEIEWRRSHEVWRSSALVELMRTSFGWTVAQMDQMFLEASEL